MKVGLGVPEYEAPTGRGPRGPLSRTRKHPRDMWMSDGVVWSPMCWVCLVALGGDSIALKCAGGDAGGDDGGDVPVLGGVGADD